MGSCKSGPDDLHGESETRLGSLSSTGDDERTHQVVLQFSLERYKYILQQINTVNENVYKFLAMYQALASATVGAALILFVGYRRWVLSPTTARTGVLSLVSLETVIASFAALLILIGVLAWLDYRAEECELTNKIVHEGFRKPPRVNNFYRWYETYILIFIAASTIFLWVVVLKFILPAIK